MIILIPSMYLKFSKAKKRIFETKIIEIINRNSSVYNFKNVDLAFMYPELTMTFLQPTC